MKSILLPLGTMRIAVADALNLMIENWPDNDCIDFYIDGNGDIDIRFSRGVTFTSEQRKAINDVDTAAVKKILKENLQKEFIQFCQDKNIVPTCPMRPWTHDYTGEGLQNGIYEISVDEFGMFALPYGFEMEYQNAPSPKGEAVKETSQSSNAPGALACLEVFRSMTGLHGEELTIAFTGSKPEHDNLAGLGANNMLRISARGEIRTVAVASLDLVNKQYGGPNREGAILIGFMQGRKPPKNNANATTISKLRKILKTQLGITSDPFHVKDLNWEPRFKIEDKRGESEKRDKREAEKFRTISFDEINERGEKVIGELQSQQNYNDDYTYENDTNDAAAEFLSGYPK